MDCSCTQFPNVSTHIQVRYWCQNWRFVTGNIPRIGPDAPEELETPEELEPLTWLYQVPTLRAGHTEYWDLCWSWLPLHGTPPKAVHYACSLSIWAVTAWCRIIGWLKNLADLDRGWSWDLGEWQHWKIHVFKLSLLLIVDKYESPNAVYLSEGDPIVMIFGCFKILQQC